MKRPSPESVSAKRRLWFRLDRPGDSGALFAGSESCPRPWLVNDIGSDIDGRLDTVSPLHVGRKFICFMDQLKKKEDLF